VSLPEPRPEPTATPVPGAAGAVAAHFDSYAEARDGWKEKNRYYHEQLSVLARQLVPPGKRVLELGCGTGDLLAALEPDPASSLGVDLSARMVARAREKHPSLSFQVADAEDLALHAGTTFDVIVLSDLVGYLTDVYATLRRLHAVCHAETRILITYFNFLWEGALTLGERLGLKMPQNTQNWLSRQDIENLLFLADFRVVDEGVRLLVPKAVPVVAPLLNALAPRTPGLKHLCLVQFFVAQAQPNPIRREDPSVTVVVPCRNEAGNVHDAIARMPRLGRHTEVLFVDGSSTDGTVERIEAEIKANPSMDIKLLHQVSPEEVARQKERPDRMLKLGKGDAVRKAFEAATGDVLMILDADLTVPPEDLPKFLDPLLEGKADFVNGSRLVYPLEDQSMRFLNLCGNKVFSLIFSWLLEQPIKDTLCGTKVLRRADYRRIQANRAYFGEFDPFGDFDLLFGAARLGMEIVDMPIRYKRRTSGDSKVRVVGHGWLLLRMSLIGFRKLKLRRWLGGTP